MGPSATAKLSHGEGVVNLNSWQRANPAHTWKDGIKIYATKGAKAFEEWLNTIGVESINKVNKALQGAHSWHEKVDQHATLHEPVHA
jgi:hypothetical protein